MGLECFPIWLIGRALGGRAAVPVPCGKANVLQGRLDLGIELFQNPQALKAKGLCPGGATDSHVQHLTIVDANGHRLPIYPLPYHITPAIQHLAKLLLASPTGLPL
jgi:hypothetical protein